MVSLLVKMFDGWDQGVPNDSNSSYRIVQTTISQNGLLILCQPPFDFLDKCFTFYPYTFLPLLIVLWF